MVHNHWAWGWFQQWRGGAGNQTLRGWTDLSVPPGSTRRELTPSRLAPGAPRGLSRAPPPPGPGAGDTGVWALCPMEGVPGMEGRDLRCVRRCPSVVVGGAGVTVPGEQDGGAQSGLGCWPTAFWQLGGGRLTTQRRRLLSSQLGCGDCPSYLYFWKSKQIRGPWL